MMKCRSVAKITVWVCCVSLSGIAQEPAAPSPAEKVYCADAGLCLHAPTPDSLETPSVANVLVFGSSPESTAVAPLGTAAEEPGSAQSSPQTSPATQAAPAVQPPASSQTTPHGQPGAAKLTIHDAEQLGLKNHPRITVAELTALASGQVYREVRSAFFPTIASNTTGVTVYNEGNRITAGLLNNPSVFERAASGLAASQLITDFGRTRNLTTSANLNAQSQQQDAVATREQIVLAVDQAFYNALSTDVLVRVADETVQARQILVKQIQALENAKLRSALDLSFANVSLAQAQLLLVNARNNRDAAYATLSETLGLPDLQPFELIEPAPQTPPAQNIDAIIQQALDNRPDLKALEFAQSADEHLATAEERLQLPNINALGAAGVTPVGDTGASGLKTSDYGAVGVNINIPVFNGFLFSARAQEAKLRARASAQRVRDLKDTVSHDVRVAWLNMNSAFEREGVAAQLLDQATLGLNLAQARYNLGLSSIVELTQAQLQQVEAEISTVTAKYDYEFAISSLEFQTGAITH
jgi:outer membrane protein